MFLPTNKQREFLFAQDKRLNFLSGSVRSGKTYISLLKWCLWIASMPKNVEFIMVGKTIGSLKRNCFNYIEDFIGAGNFKYSISGKIAKIFGRTVWLEGANDERAENKIRGMTLAGAYCDEVTLFPESFFTMLLTRLSVNGAKLYATCNPDNPNHYIKTQYIDKQESLNCAVWNFLLTDNTTLGEEYLESIVKEFSGVAYNRFILGQWVRAEGVIYTRFANDTEAFLLPIDYDYKKEIVAISIGVDFGGSKSATTFVCTGFTRGLRNVIILESERHEEELAPNMLDRLYADFVKMCTSKYGKACNTYADSAEQILIRGLRNIALREGLMTNVKNAKKSLVKDRIMAVNKLINTGRFWVMRHCTTVIKALQDAVWDEDKEDERLDDFTSDIDTLDAMEYSIEPYFSDLLKT